MLEYSCDILEDNKINEFLAERYKPKEGEPESNAFRWVVKDYNHNLLAQYLF